MIKLSFNYLVPMRALIICFFLATLAHAADYQGPIETKEKFVVDDKTKITIYMRADRCHFCGITPSGVVLWKKNFFPFARGNPPRIDKFEAKGGTVLIESTGGGTGSSLLEVDAQTGKMVGSQSL